MYAKIQKLTLELNEKFAGQARPEGWPINDKVITNMPIQYVLGKHTADREIEDVSIEWEGDEIVAVKVTEETTEYLESNPTGEFNLSITQKHKKVGNYQSISYQNYTANQHNSRLAERKRK